MSLSDFGQGNAYFRNGVYDKAVACYQKAVEGNPGFHHYYKNLAKALVHLGKSEEAQAAQHHEKSLELKNSQRWRQKANNTIEVIRGKLLSLGFTDRPLEELTDIANNSWNIFARSMAARELALWYMRTKSEKDYRIALDWIARARVDAPDREFRSKLSTVELLCHYHLKDRDAGLTAYDRAALAGESTPNLVLARVNFETTPENRVLWINQVLASYRIEPVTLLPDTGQPAYDRLTCAVDLPKITDEPKVSVLIAAYDAAQMLPTALRSLQEQTWANLEIIVLDDCSPEMDTMRVAERFAASDPRIRVVRMASNGGAYVARNHGLDMATGEFVTLHDADDWSHPRKIETQVRFMMENPTMMGCTSQQARVSEGYEFSVARRNGALIFPNISSFLFAREKVVESVGYWDAVRFGADAQYIKRIQAHFGPSVYSALESAPLSFQRSTEGSATGNKDFGFDGFKFGARKTYENFEECWMQVSADKKLSMKEPRRPFFAPAPMRINRPRQPRHFDVIIASDFRFPGGTTSSNVEEIKAQKAKGMKTGLAELYSYGFSPKKPMNEKIRTLIDCDAVDLISFGEEVHCRTLVIRQPMCINSTQRYVPKIHAECIRVVINQTPKRDYTETGETIYSLSNCAATIHDMFGMEATWHPIGPLVRNALLQHHSADLKNINLSTEDWLNIIDPKDWRRNRQPFHDSRPIRICRYSRDAYTKWPCDPKTVRQVYFDGPDIEIHVLGGAKTPKEVLGGILPSNWHVSEFGSVQPADFLADKDVFVYFTHPYWIESFGRSILEPMCAGIPVIIPDGQGYEELFEEAAIYRKPKDVRETIYELMSNPALYAHQVESALGVVRRKFSHDVHVMRLSKLHR